MVAVGKKSSQSNKPRFFALRDEESREVVLMRRSR